MAYKSTAILGGLGLMLALGGCAGPRPLDPQAPVGAAPQKSSPATIVLCPEGSSYDQVRNVCVASGSITPTDKPVAEVATAQAHGSSLISVRCSFANGWVAVLPESEYPSDDSYLMQALIGLSQERDFWAGQTEYADLEPFAAKRCTSKSEEFRVAPGSYFIVAGEAETFSRKGRYYKNGFRRKVQVSNSSPVNLSLGPNDLTHTWNCISCPFVSFWDAEARRFLPAFVVLAYRSSEPRKGTDRVHMANVPVQNGKIRLRLVEAEQEISHVDQLVLEVQGRRLYPTVGRERSALAETDSATVEMRQGTQVIVEYEAPFVTGSTVEADVIASGYYDPVGL